MSGSIGTRQKFVGQLRSAFAALHRGDHRGAVRAFIPYDKGILEFEKLRDARRRALNKAKEMAAREFLDANVPPAFLHHVASLYPDPETLRVVEAICPPSEYDQEGEPIPNYQGGLLFFGASGSGKTRAAFRLLQRWAIYENLRFRYLSAPVLKRQLADAARAG